jgi:hypothetical protein
MSKDDASIAACSWIPAWGPFRHQGRTCDEGTRTGTSSDSDDHGPGEGPAR